MLEIKHQEHEMQITNRYQELNYSLAGINCQISCFFIILTYSN